MLVIYLDMDMKRTLTFSWVGCSFYLCYNHLEVMKLSTRSAFNWESKPGNIDSLNTEYTFESNNDYGIPLLLPNKNIPKDLIMYGTEVRRSYAQTRGKTVHFFLDDYKFEPLWNKPFKTLQPIINIGSALTPDFSLYTDYPLALQIYNVYRNRWLGRYWQEHDVDVIPTVAWGDERSFDFCFSGIEKNVPVAIGTVGINNKEARKNFIKGFEKMIEVLEPSDLIIYGETEPVNFSEYFGDNVYKFESYWAKRRKELNGR